MDGAATFDAGRLLYILLAVAGAASVLALILLIRVLRTVKRVHLPPGADPLTALRATPFAVVVLLDLLDLGLDFLSAPISWVLLGRLGLAPLRGVTVIEELIPGTQFIPTMTAAWIIARLAGRERRE